MATTLRYSYAEPPSLSLTLSVSQTLYYGKTLLCLPLLGDQSDIAARIVDGSCSLPLVFFRLSFFLRFVRVVKDAHTKLCTHRTILPPLPLPSLPLPRHVHT